MLITGTLTSSRKFSEMICMYRARTTKSTFPVSSSRMRASAAVLSGPWEGTWKNGIPNERTSSATLVWLEITIGIVTGSSPRRCRQSSSRRQ